MNTEHNNHGQEPHNEDHIENKDEVLKTFDMYSFFSRKDVLLAIGFIVILLLILMFKTIFAPQVV